MLDIKFIRENKDLLQTVAGQKNIKVDLDKLIKLDDKRKALNQKIDELRSQKNQTSKEIPQMDPKDREIALEKMKVVDAEQDKLEEQLKPFLVEINALMLEVPMYIHKDTPIAIDESGNVSIREVGEIRKFDFTIKDHVQLGKDLDIIDGERGVKIGGSRAYVLKGDGARLEQSLLKYAQDFISRKGYTLMYVPVIVDRFALEGTGFLPGSEDQIYHLEKDDKYLVGTSEVALGAYYSNEVLDIKNIPCKMAGISTCFRREAGTYGKDTSGVYRVHQFNKVEQFILCEGDAEKSQAMFDELAKNVEEFLASLKLPYRILNICTGDMGRGKYQMYDFECWMPSRKNYGETHSCSNLHDFQARRLNLRYKDAEGKINFCHTLNNTLVATPRILIPLLELNQNEDGSVTIPEVLRPYMDNQEKIVKK
ncbi:MAG: Seryl-tRNA synthetase [Parcubacteria group bacterium GW2011_GWC2_38_7]|nr:MAG: Seryl-tRNA synthetase [Parcubacteria group bacterium GW2011_GWC2_38_7]